MSTTDAFLRGQGVPIDLAKAESELIKLWGPAAAELGGSGPENPPVTRVALANLVVFGPASAVDEVIARRPCRTIQLVEEPADGPNPPGKLHSEVSALCHLPAPGQPQVCSEKIVIFADPRDAGLWPGAVRPLLEAGLPTILWWVGDPSTRPELYAALSADASRVILEAPDPGTPVEALAHAFDRANQPYVHDRAWFGATPWREAIALQYDPPDLGALGAIASVNIHALTPARPGMPRVAAWLAAWLIGQLKWGSPEPTGSGPDRASFRTAGDRPVTIDLSWETLEGLDVPQIQSIEIRHAWPAGHSGPSSIALRRPKPDRPELCVGTSTDDACSLPHTILAPEFGPPGRIIAALESSRLDPPFRAAIPHALKIMGHG